MSVTDLIADQLTVIRNAIMSKKKSVIIRRSTPLEGIVRIMKEEGFIEDFQVIEDDKQGRIKLYLKWTEDGLPVMEDMQKVSTSGRRVYLSVKDVPTVKGGTGIAIISTSKGLLTDKQAKDQNVGGEIICKVW